MSDLFRAHWSPDINLGSLVNAVLLIAAIAAGWATMQYRMAAYEDRLAQHDERLGKIESLQVTLAELVIRQQHVMEETARIETAVERRLDRIDMELDRVRIRIREIEVARGD